MIQQLLASAYKGNFECGKLQHRRRSKRLRKLALLEFLQLVCGVPPAAERESPQHEPQQHSLIGYSPADAAAARPGSSQLEEHQEHHAQDAHIAPRPLLNVQDRSRPGSVETVERQAASDSESQCQAPDSPVSPQSERSGPRHHHFYMELRLFFSEHMHSTVPYHLAC